MNRYRNAAGNLLCNAVAMLLAVPAIGATEDPATAAPREPVIVREDISIRMRDGVHLAADLYLPENKAGTAPRYSAVLVQTPYGKTDTIDFYRYLAEGGDFAVVIEDSRGRYKSQGAWADLAGVAEDSADTLDWIAAQPWSNGRVGMIGCSASGHAALAAAMVGHPALKAIVAGGAGGQHGPARTRFGRPVHHSMWYFNGIPLTGILLSYLASVAANGNPALPNAAPITEDVNEYPAVLQNALIHRPVIEQFAMLGIKAPHYERYWRDILTRSATSGELLERLPLFGEHTSISVPALHVNSWMDGGPTEALLAAQLFSHTGITQRVRSNQFAIIDPGTHCDQENATQNMVIGDRELGDARFPHKQTYLQWFHHWLDSDSQGDFKAPKFRYYQMGTNEWRDSEVWPPRGAEAVQFFLNGKGRANTRHGDGQLTRSAPRGESRDDLVHDPANPVPLFGRGGPYSAGYFDQSRIEDRDDVLVYSTPPLQRDLEVVGPLSAVLHVSTSAKDADFFIKLIDVYPDGRAFNVHIGGAARLRYREGLQHSSTVQPGRIYRLEFPLIATANTFKRGHRLRIEIASSAVPVFDPNPGDGGPIHLAAKVSTATNSIHMSQSAPSHILLTARPR